MIRICGDICLSDGYFDMGFGVGSLLKKGHYNPFLNIKENPDDIWIGNLECVVSDRSDCKGFKRQQFRVSPKWISKINHFRFFGVANNHVMQHGEEAYREMIINLERIGVSVFGSKEKKSCIFDQQGQTVSLTGFSYRIDSFSKTPLYWHNPELQELRDEIASLPSDAFKIVFIHWGCEFIRRPSLSQKHMAHWLIDNGFDLVVGMHPHVLQGYEQYKGKYIFYSLGNFVFDMPWTPTKYGAVVSVDLGCANGKCDVDYVHIEDDFRPRIVSEVDVPEALQFKSLNEMLTIDDNPEEYCQEIMKCYKQYRKANHKDIARKILMHPSIGGVLVGSYIKRRIIH